MQNDENSCLLQQLFKNSKARATDSGILMAKYCKIIWYQRTVYGCKPVATSVSTLLLWFRAHLSCPFCILNRRAFPNLSHQHLICSFSLPVPYSIKKDDVPSPTWPLSFIIKRDQIIALTWGDNIGPYISLAIGRPGAHLQNLTKGPLG